MNVGKHPAKADIIYEELKRRIIQLELKDGNQLTEEMLAEEFLSSRTPVRQALQRLARDNFVKLIPFVGCIVHQLTISDIEEIYTLREALEGMAANCAAQVIDEQNLALIEEDIRRARYSMDAVDGETPGKVLHDVLLNLMGNMRITQIMNNVSEQVQWLHNYSLTLPGQSEHARLEHEAVLEALYRHDSEEAERCMRIHIRNTKDLVIHSFRNTMH